MGDEKQVFRDFLTGIGYPSNLISVEVAWASQQRAGTAKKIVSLVTYLREQLDERRK